MRKNTILFLKAGLVAVITISCVLIVNDSHAQGRTSLKFEISFPKNVHSTAITGRAYVIISSDNRREPRFQVSPTGVPIWGINIDDLRPGESAIINGDVPGYPLQSIDEIPAGDYYIQGFINRYTEFKRRDGHTLWMHDDQWEGQDWRRSPGNLYSDVNTVHIDPARGSTIQLSCSNMIPPVEVPVDTKWVKRVKFRSKILSEFWGQSIYLGATVLLPEGYDDNSGFYYPVNYIQGHFSLRAPFGFDSEDPGEQNPRARRGYEFYEYWISDDCPRMIAVTFQHPCPYYDDSYAVNSANVGPYGDAIMNELIPYIEEHFRIIREPYARGLSGGSTGGWESLALQVYNPDFFGGTWSSCPDPVDFRYYQIVDIYEDGNAYYKRNEWHKVERPNNRSSDGSIRYTMKDENLYELVIGDKGRSGGQWDIWEAVFSPVGEDGYPTRIWDKLTGKIDHSVAEYWKEHYDIRHYLEKNWSWLGPKLVGKLHIYVGDMDTYYLNNAVVLLEDFLENTENPHYGGLVKYGDGEPHCWGPGGKELVELFAEHVRRNAPSGGE